MTDQLPNSYDEKQAAFSPAGFPHWMFVHELRALLDRLQFHIDAGSEEEDEIIDIVSSNLEVAASELRNHMERRRHRAAEAKRK